LLQWRDADSAKSQARSSPVGVAGEGLIHAAPALGMERFSDRETKDMKGILGAGLLAGLIALTAGPALAQTKLRVGTNQNIDAAALEVARVKGFLAEEGLDVEITPVVGGAASLPTLAAGKIDIAASNLISIVLGVKNDLPFKIIGAGDAGRPKAPDLAGMISKTGSGLKTGKDLEGKKVATNTRNNIIWLFARAWIEKTGGDPDKVNFVEVPFPQMIDALAQGRADAAFLVEPFLSSGLNTKNYEAIGWPYVQVLPGTPISQWVATEDFVKANGPTIEKFARALNKASDWIAKNETNPEWFTLVSAYTKMSPEAVQASAVPVFEKKLDPAAIEQVIALMRKHGLLSSGDKIDVGKLLHSTVR
jgi:NitT/TauT family transport system substrate-binding protein